MLNLSLGYFGEFCGLGFGFVVVDAGCGVYLGVGLVGWCRVLVVGCGFCGFCFCGCFCGFCRFRCCLVSGMLAGWFCLLCFLVFCGAVMQVSWFRFRLVVWFAVFRLLSMVLTDYLVVGLVVFWFVGVFVALCGLVPFWVWCVFCGFGECCVVALLASV